MTTPASQGVRPGRLAGKVALITGTGGGQGRVAAQRFAEEGAVVVGCDLDAAGNQETERLVSEGGGEMTATAPVDLGEPEQVAAWVDGAASRFGAIDVLYNNAASPKFAPFSEMTLEEWEHTVRNELALVFHACKAVWPHMVAGSGGSIVNVSGYSAIDGQPAGSAAHAAAKGGVIGLGHALSVEGSPHRIRVNTVVPGIVDTEVTRKMIPSDRFELINSIVKLGRVATPDDVVGCALYLASDESSVVTGTEIVVGGGNALFAPQLGLMSRG